MTDLTGNSCTQTYRSRGSFLQLWFEAAAHQNLQGQYQPWGGLWTADSAETFISNAVHMYTSEAEWGGWQQQGLQLLHELYDRDTTLQAVQVKLISTLTLRFE